MKCAASFKWLEYSYIAHNPQCGIDMRFEMSSNPIMSDIEAVEKYPPTRKYYIPKSYLHISSHSTSSSLSLSLETENTIQKVINDCFFEG